MSRQAGRESPVVRRGEREGGKHSQNHAEAIENEHAVVAPVVVVIRREEGARARSLPLFNLPQKMFAVQTHLIFRRPKLRQPKPEDESDDRSADEAVLKD